MSELNTATTIKKETPHGLESNAQRLGQSVGQLHDDLAGIARTTGEVAHIGVATVKEGVKTTFDAARDKTDQAAATVRGRMASHPMANLGIAVGVGVAIGLVGSAIVRSRSRKAL